MLGLDTNVVVRFLAQDDRVQSPLASRLFGRLSKEAPGFVSVVAMVETSWVLERVYGYDDKEIASTIESLLQTDSLRIECEQEVFVAMTVLQDGCGSFADALIAALGVKAGCSRTLTFDRKTARLAGFELVRSGRH